MRVGVWALLVVSALVVLTTGVRPAPAPIGDRPAEVIGGPYADLLASSVDLGPSHDRTAQLIVELRGSARPQTLLGVGPASGIDRAVAAGAAVGGRRR